MHFFCIFSSEIASSGHVLVIFMQRFLVPAGGTVLLDPIKPSLPMA